MSGRNDRKTPWGSKEMRRLLKNMGITEEGNAMSLVMSLDFASRDRKEADYKMAAYRLARLRFAGTEQVNDPKTLSRFGEAIAAEYDALDRAFQPEAYENDEHVFFDDDVSSFFGSDDGSKTFAMRMSATEDRMVELFGSGDIDGGRSLASSFAKDSVNKGFWDKSESDLSQYLIKKAASEAKKRRASDKSAPKEQTKRQVQKFGTESRHELNQIIFKELLQGWRSGDRQKVEDATGWSIEELVKSGKNRVEAKKAVRRMLDEAAKRAGGPKTADVQDDESVPVKLADIKKVDFKTVADVYGFDEDDTDALTALTKSIVKKGTEDPATLKSAKDLLASSKKKKKKPKVKHGKHLVLGMMDALRRAVMKKRVTKPMKLSDADD